MLKPSVANNLNITEPAQYLLDKLDENKTTTVFAVSGAPKASDEPGDFMGIISRQRYTCTSMMCWDIVKLPSTC